MTDALCFYIPQTNIEEQFVYVTDIVVPDIISNRYMVSNYGRLLDTKSMKYFPNERFYSSRYVYVHIKCNNGEKFIGLHVIVLRTFNYIYGCENLLVNHKDGIKYHNWIWNLEWCTYSENIKHGYDTGLHPIGEQNTTSKVSNKDVEQICYLMSLGYRTKDIISELQDQLPGINIKCIVDAIKIGKYWNHISCKYDMSNVYHSQNKFLLSDEQVESICKILQEYGKVNTYKELLSMVGYDYSKSDIKELHRLKQEISLIRNKKTKKGICDLYNY